MNKRFVSLWWPDWPLACWQRTQQHRHPAERTALDAGPFALVATQAQGRYLAALNLQARAAGLRCGQSLSDARAILPALAVAPLDAAGNVQALQQLVLWLQRYTPWVTPEGADGALLDITGCAHLWGGEAALCADVRSRLRASSLTSRVGVASTPGTAWALARFGRTPCLVQPDTSALADWLAPLPVAALQLMPGTVDILQRLGLKRIGDLLPIPRAALARRFRTRQVAQDVLERLDQALGRVPDPRVPATRPPAYRCQVRMMEPILEAGQIASWLAHLLGQLMPELAASALGVRRLELSCFCVDGSVQRTSVGCARPVRDAAHLARLFSSKIETITPGFGIDALTLTATHTAPLAAAQSSLTSTPEATADSLADSLINRFSNAAVHKLSLRQSHIPERSEARVAYDARVSAKLHQLARRPLLLLGQPEPATALAQVPDGAPRQLVWRRKTHQIVRAHGPERIGPEWWRGNAREHTRDYYWVEDKEGVRLWVFRHGLFDQQMPSWFVHGLDG